MDDELADEEGAEVAIDPEITGLIAYFQREDGVVPELIRGESVNEVVASVEVARAAYWRIAANKQRALADKSRELRQNAGSDASFNPVALRPVPAGGNVRRTTPTDVSGLSAAAKIRRGLEEKD